VSTTSVSVVVARVVRPGREPTYETWLQRAVAAARRYPGHAGAEVLRPSGADRRYVLVFRFEMLEQLLAWEHSPERAALLREAEALTEGTPVVQRRTGLEGWFTLPGQPIFPPPRWKMALVTWLVAFPLIQVLGLAWSPVLSGAPQVLRSAVVGASMVLTMTYAAMPAVTRVLGAWLRP
jgi:antibiotic biosynthesis monooxygenase (ABM) superfamily enzyme